MNIRFILLIPILEILTFILFGDFFGFFLVLFMIFLTGFLGLILFNSRIQIDQLRELALNPNDWVYKKIAAILLIIPGFITDFLGLVLLVKSLRGFAWQIIAPKNKEKYRNEKNKQENVIDVDYKDLDEK
tara:strand:+ start:209 stop:598 length:390 start_codon:yes stop_codon:yes gene_type:complete